MSTLVVTNLSLGAGGLPNGSVLTDDIEDNAITTAKIANANITAAKLNGAQTGSAPIYGARAWVNFDGTGTFSPNPSTTKIRASGNVSSITDNGTGDYTINFTTAMPDTNYSVSGAVSQAGNTSRGMAFELHPTSPLSTTSCKIRAIIINTSPTPNDADVITAIVMR